MFKRGLLSVLVSFVMMAWIFGCREEGEPVLTGHPGYPVYEKYCRRCHGHRGDAVKASRMAKRQVSLIDAAYRDTTDVADVKQVVLTGQGRMKGYETKLTPEEVDAVSRYTLEMPPRLLQP
jgi:mono/diheme cytochrome c family protein